MKKLVFRISALSALVSFLAVAVMAGGAGGALFENFFENLVCLAVFGLSLAVMNRTFEE